MYPGTRLEVAFQMARNDPGGWVVRLNGVVVARDEQALQSVLRGVARSDSPILLEGQPALAAHLVERLHILGRRAALPLHQCWTAEDAQPLLDGLKNTPPPGTWVLWNLPLWPVHARHSLREALEQADEGRLAGRFHPETLPRIVGVGTQGLETSLVQRLGFFRLVVQMS